MFNLQETINWDNEDFIKQFFNCTSRYEKKKKLKEVSASNYEIIKQKSCPTPWTYKYEYKDYPYIANNFCYGKKGIITIEDLTTDDAIVKYSDLGYEVIALNYANAFTPGGGYLNGSIAQEEELCRQYPHLYNSLKNSKHSKKNYYPLSNNHLLITHDIKRYRENCNNGYKVIKNPDITAGFITTAAPNMRSIKNKGKQFDDYRGEIHKLLKMIFSVAYTKLLSFLKTKFRIKDSEQKGYDVLIIGAWGCGAFAPIGTKDRIRYITDMANLMAYVANQYRHMYDYISVAIPDKNSENYKIFRKAFSKII